jgi:hypothetical protein
VESRIGVPCRRVPLTDSYARATAKSCPFARVRVGVIPSRMRPTRSLARRMRMHDINPDKKSTEYCWLIPGTGTDDGHGVSVVPARLVLNINFGPDWNGKDPALAKLPSTVPEFESSRRQKPTGSRSTSTGRRQSQAYQSHCAKMKNLRTPTTMRALRNGANLFRRCWAFSRRRFSATGGSELLLCHEASRGTGEGWS